MKKNLEMDWREMMEDHVKLKKLKRQVQTWNNHQPMDKNPIVKERSRDPRERWKGADGFLSERGVGLRTVPNHNVQEREDEKGEY